MASNNDNTLSPFFMIVPFALFCLVNAFADFFSADEGNNCIGFLFSAQNCHGCIVLRFLSVSRFCTVQLSCAMLFFAAHRTFFAAHHALFAAFRTASRTVRLRAEKQTISENNVYRNYSR